MKELGLDERGAEYLLWDRLLHRELTASRKSIIADKTPNNVFIVDRLREAWPDARFIFLLRHPGAIARSRQKYKGEGARRARSSTYVEALEAARQTYDGHTVRYEDLTAEPRARAARDLRLPRRRLRADDARLRPVRPRPLQVRPRRLEREDQVRRHPAARAAAAARGDRPRAARDVREVGLPRRAEVPLDRGA